MTYNFEDQGNKPIVDNIESMTLENENYRTTIWTGSKIQVTLMTIQSGDNIGLEIHHGIEQGKGLCQMGPTENHLNFEKEANPDDAIIVPADTWHNVTNIGDTPLKLYSLYGGPDHKFGTVHKTHQDAENNPNEH